MAGNIVIVGGGAGGLELACKLGRKLGRGQVTLVDAACTTSGSRRCTKSRPARWTSTRKACRTRCWRTTTASPSSTAPMIGARRGGAPADGRRRARGHGGERSCRNAASATTSLVHRHRQHLQLLRRAGRARTHDLAQRHRRRRTLPPAHAAAAGAGRTCARTARPRRRHWTSSSSAAAPPASSWRPNCAKPAASMRALRLAPPASRERDVRITLARRRAAHPGAAAGAGVRRRDPPAGRARRHGRAPIAAWRDRPDQVTDADGNVYPADLCVWAAGIKAPEFLAQLGLPTNKGGQIEVDGHLRVKGVPRVFALGDCAACVGADGKPVPPRAQAAHQQADYLLQALLRAGERASPHPTSPTCTTTTARWCRSAQHHGRQPDGLAARA